MKRNRYNSMIRPQLILAVLIYIAIPSFGQSFEDYYKIALENNPGLKAKHHQFEASMQRIDQATSLPDPTFSFGYFISPVETRVGPQRAKLSLSQMFPWFGTLKAKGNSAAIAASGKYQELLNAQSQVYQKLAGYYYPLYELDKKIFILEQNIELLETYKSIALIKFENGQVPMVDVLRTDLLINKSETEITILEKQKSTYTVGFNSLLNRAPDTTVVISDTIIISQEKLLYRSDSLFDNHPLVKSYEFQAAASEAQIDAITAQSKPGFGVGLDYVIVGDAPMPVEDSGRDIIMPMVSISLPIFGGKYKAAKNEAKAMAESYNQMRLQSINDFQSGYSLTSFKMEKALDKLNLYDKQIQNLKQMLNLQFKAYANSGENFEELLRIQQELLEYQSLQLEAIKEYKLSEAELMYYLDQTGNKQFED
ncbi:TolC family protein [Marinigracilibium pacificum]|uniref:TolC family protein n=1 Tax=Marinigracilibium pacificum TaxID=2729599 RepID=A0A848J530_9BACT|nr:TolC family protein [Marinigracilibium pacificum]NMM48262.1 TolC family protein [Marinigracilibium pacificum]